MFKALALSAFLLSSAAYAGDCETTASLKAFTVDEIRTKHLDIRWSETTDSAVIASVVKNVAMLKGQPPFPLGNVYSIVFWRVEPGTGDSMIRFADANTCTIGLATVPTKTILGWFSGV